MRYLTFPGGVHPNGHKEMSNGRPVQTLMPKGDLVFFLSQHIGKPAAPVVKKGDPVLAGQIIAKADGFISSNVVSSCSGTVKAVEPRLNPSGVMMPAIVVANDGQFTPAPGVGVKEDLFDLSNSQILNRIKEAGIVGLGGAGFPTVVKMMPKKNPDSVDYIIANGAECEPYITCDDMLMRERANEIVEGIKIVQRLFRHAKGVIAIEENKPEALKALERAVKGTQVEVAVLKTKFPQGGERSLIYSITGRKLAAGKLPAEMGVIVDNVGTMAAIYRAVCLNEPLMEKYFTVSGDAVVNPGNYLVRVGTSISEILEAAGGLKEDTKKVLLGGPMMGTAITNLDAPIVKANNALTCLTVDQVEEAEKAMTNCIHCGRCTRVCPVGLVPQLMGELADRKDYKRYEKIHGLECIGCGSCTYICPAKRPLVAKFKEAKNIILANKAKEASK